MDKHSITLHRLRTSKGGLRVSFSRKDWVSYCLLTISGLLAFVFEETKSSQLEHRDEKNNEEDYQADGRCVTEFQLHNSTLVQELRHTYRSIRGTASCQDKWFFKDLYRTGKNADGYIQNYWFQLRNSDMEESLHSICSINHRGFVQLLW